MQILKCLIAKKAQNLIEFVFVLPILLFMVLAIFETALYWQDVNAVYNLNAEINANAALAELSNMPAGSVCAAASAAETILNKKASMITINKPNFTKSVKEGIEPFALYEFNSGVISAGTTVKPQATLWVDCRNPMEKGIDTQVEFYHKTVILSAKIPRFDGGDPLVVIPDNLFIASTKLNTLRQY